MAPEKLVKRGEAGTVEKISRKYLEKSFYLSIFLAGIISSMLMKPLHEESYMGVTENLVEYQVAPKYFGVSSSNPKDELVVNRVFDYIGFKKAKTESDWDVTWSFENPFNATGSIIHERVTKALKPHQRVNHFPGSDVLTDKTRLTTRNREMEELMQGFDFSQGEKQIREFKDFVKAHPDTRFLEKSKSGIKLMTSSQILLENNNKYYQVFMEEPFLIDGRAMEISVIVLIASVDPIRIYRFNEEVFVRFCEKSYNPLDPNNVKQFVVSEMDLFSRMPSLKDYQSFFGYSMKISIGDFFNYTDVWDSFDRALVRMIVSSEANILREVRGKSLRNYSIVKKFIADIENAQIVSQLFRAAPRRLSAQ